MNILWRIGGLESLYSSILMFDPVLKFGPSLQM